MTIIFSRQWAMPNKDTFSVKPIGQFVTKYLGKSLKSVDPFARNKRWATVTNDIDPKTDAEFHMDAEDFLKSLRGHEFDLVIFDPPYSPRQISECYKGIGMEVGMKETQSALLYKRVRDAIPEILAPGGIVLSFGWSTNGMGIGRNFEIIEIMLCAHGGAHNDTICMAERLTR
jgi:23S rRNA G2069 N7-methylase RlmK/C1962 C5-methylase RlmI